MLKVMLIMLAFYVFCIKILFAAQHLRVNRTPPNLMDKLLFVGRTESEGGVLNKGFVMSGGSLTTKPMTPNHLIAGGMNGTIAGHSSVYTAQEGEESAGNYVSLTRCDQLVEHDSLKAVSIDQTDAIMVPMNLEHLDLKTSTVTSLLKFCVKPNYACLSEEQKSELTNTFQIRFKHEKTPCMLECLLYAMQSRNHAFIHNTFGDIYNEKEGTELIIFAIENSYTELAKNIAKHWEFQQRCHLDTKYAMIEKLLQIEAFDDTELLAILLKSQNEENIMPKSEKRRMELLMMDSQNNLKILQLLECAIQKHKSRRMILFLVQKLPDITIDALKHANSNRNDEICQILINYQQRKLVIIANLIMQSFNLKKMVECECCTQQIKILEGPKQSDLNNLNATYIISQIINYNQAAQQLIWFYETIKIPINPVGNAAHRSNAMRMDAMKLIILTENTNNDIIKLKEQLRKYNLQKMSEIHQKENVPKPGFKNKISRYFCCFKKLK